MKKVVKKVVSLLLVAVMVFSVAPLAGFVGLELPEINLFSIGAKAEEVATSGTCGDNLTWTFDESTGELTISGTGAMDDYMYSSSPWADHRSSIKTLSISDDVTSIGNYAFASCSGLTNIELPDGLTNIGEHAFEHCVGLINITIPSNVVAINNYTFLGCENLTDIVISNGVATIGGYVFKDCDKLKTLNIPASVTDIRYDAFEYCYNLETINVDSANETYSSDEHGVLFNKDKTAIKKYPKGNRGKSYTIPDGVISIDKFAFRRCYYLTSLQIPDSVMYISENAFEESTIYENLDNWENGVLYISNHLIKANKSLKGVYQVREGTKSIAANAFVDCSGLTGVILPEGLASIDWGAFGFCVNLRGLVIPYGVTNIGEMAFFNCVAMEYIHVPSSVTSIGTDCIISDSSKAELIEDLKTYSEEELASLGFTKESVEAFSSTTLICSDSESAYAKTYARQNGNEFAVCDGHSGEEIPDASERLLLHSGFCGENLTFTLYADGELVISGTGDMYDWDEETPWYNYKQFIKTVTVDNGVTSIGSYAFMESYYLEKITIPDSVKSIGAIAFYCCYRLDNVAIPDSVINIGENAFYNCMAMEYIHIPSSVTTIGNNIIMPDDDKAELKTYFDSCTEDALVEFAHVGITKEHGSNWLPTTLICSDSENSAAKTFAEQNGNQFEVCNGHDSGETPDLITGICGDNLTWTFDESTGELVISGTGDMWDWGPNSAAPWYGGRSVIKAITISDGVTSIGNNAFVGCDVLTSVTIPDGVTSIGEYAFSQCTGLENITIGNNVTSIGDNAFTYCYALTSIIIPDSVTSIGDNAFAACTGLTSIEIPHSVTSLGDYVFAVCNGLTSITVDPANTAYSSDEYGVLFNKDKTELIRYPIGNTRTNYVIPDSVTSIVTAFQYCENLTSITIPDSVTSIGVQAFEGCVNLTSIEIPDSVTSIGDSAFYRCTGLTSVEIPDSVTSIGDSAFYRCTSLTSIIISDSVTSIGEYAFEGGTKITDVYYTGTEDEWNEITISQNNNNLLNATIHYNYVAEETPTNGTCGDNLTWTFDESTGELVISGIGDMWDYESVDERPWQSYRLEIKTVTIDNGVTSIGEMAFVECYSVGSITLPDSLINIGINAFAACHMLKNVIIPDSVTSISHYAFYMCGGLEYIHIPSSLTSIELVAIFPDSHKETVYKDFEGMSEEEFAELGMVKDEILSNWSPTTVVCSDSENSAAKTFAEENGNQFKVCGGEHREEFTVTLNIDGVQSVITLKEGDAISVEEPVKEGHTFVEWTPAIPEVMPAENLEFTAVFEVNSYNVIWNIDGMLITETHKFGELMDKSKSFEKKGYTFIGWTPEIPETMPACDLEFTALFEINICDAVFNANGGMFADGDLVKRIPTEMNAGILAPEDPERAGFRFAGWANNGKNIGADVGVMDSTEGKIFDAVWIPNEKTAYKVETYTMNTYGEYEVSSMLVNAFVSEEVSVDITASEGFEINEEKSVLSGTVTSGEMLVLKVYIDRKQYKFTTVVLDTETTVLYYYGAAVPYPEWPSLNEYYVFEWWKPSPPAIMPAHDVTITAQISEWNPRIVMSTPEKRTIYYGESITLRVQTYGLPSYAKIKWEVSGDGVSIKPSASGKTCKVTSTTNGNVVVKAYAVDSRGNTIEGYNLKPVCDSEYLYSKVSLWQVIVNFIRQLFNKNDNLSQFFKGIM